MERPERSKKFVKKKTMKIQTKFTTRAQGDMRNVSDPDMIFPEQIHGSGVAMVKRSDTGKIIEGVDGLVSADPVTLGVRVADCVPILAFDEEAGVIGAAHAGWRGTLGNIAGSLIGKMAELGAQAKHIRVILGPHIGMCCYDVPKDRAMKFLSEIGSDDKIASFFENNWHVDIGFANFVQLVTAGILPENITAKVVCTSCQVDTYFSYRKDMKSTFGEQLGIIWTQKT